MSTSNRGTAWNDKRNGQHGRRGLSSETRLAEGSSIDAEVDAVFASLSYLLEGDGQAPDPEPEATAAPACELEEGDVLEVDDGWLEAGPPEVTARVVVNQHTLQTLRPERIEVPEEARPSFRPGALRWRAHEVLTPLMATLAASTAAAPAGKRETPVSTSALDRASAHEPPPLPTPRPRLRPPRPIAAARPFTVLTGLPAPAAAEPVARVTGSPVAPLEAVEPTVVTGSPVPPPPAKKPASVVPTALVTGSPLLPSPAKKKPGSVVPVAVVTGLPSALSVLPLKARRPVAVPAPAPGLSPPVPHSGWAGVMLSAALVACAGLAAYVHVQHAPPASVPAHEVATAVVAPPEPAPAAVVVAAPAPLPIATAALPSVAAPVPARAPAPAPVRAAPALARPTVTPAALAAALKGMLPGPQPPKAAAEPPPSASHPAVSAAPRPAVIPSTGPVLLEDH